MRDTRERILSEGLRLMARHGLAGVTLGVLAQRSGMSKSGLFAHFGSKEDVQLGLLAETSRVVASTFVVAAMAKPVGLPRLKKLFDGWLGWSEKAGLQGGCPLTAGMFELDDAELKDPVRQRLLAMEEEWRDFLTQLTTDAIANGDLRQNLDAKQFVWELFGIYLAHHTSYRFVRDPLATDRAMTAFNALLLRSSSVKKPAKEVARRKTK